MANLDGTDDVFDSREVIERIIDLEATATIDRDPDEQDELDALYALQEEAIGYVPDWPYGETFVSEDYFADYAREFVEDCGTIPRDLPSWIADHIDWDGVADELKADYTSFTFHGVTYWARG